MYFITCFQKYEQTKLGVPDIGSYRTFGYYNDRDVAIEMVHQNNCDIHENLYHYAVIECIPEGVYDVALERIFFEWNDEAKRYDMVDSKPFEDCFGNYAFG